jgi:hypothetical protein
VQRLCAAREVSLASSVDTMDQNPSKAASSRRPMVQRSGESGRSRDPHTSGPAVPVESGIAGSGCPPIGQSAQERSRVADHWQKIATDDPLLEPAGRTTLCRSVGPDSLR